MSQSTDFEPLEHLNDVTGIVPATGPTDTPDSMDEADHHGASALEPQTDGEKRFTLTSWSWLSFLVVVASAMAELCIRNRSLFSVPIREQGDEAANSILVNQAVHFQLLVGNYSREGFHHPGPAYLYIQSFGQDIFYSWLHVVPAQFNGQLIAIFLLNSVMLALTVLVIARHTKSWLVAVVAVAAIVLLTGGTLSWTSAWMPYLYAAPFLLATVSGVSVAVGSLKDVPIFAFAVALLVHGHVAFIAIMGSYVVVVAVAWIVLQRKDGYGARLRAAKGSLKFSAVILVVFAVPLGVELALHWPGQFGLYWHYFRSNAHKHPHTFSQTASYVERFWPDGHTGLVILGAVATATVVVAALDANRWRRRFVLGMLVSVVIMTLEVGWYARTGVDFLSLTYTGYFYYAIPTLVVVAAVVEGLGRLRDISSRPAAHHVRKKVAFVPLVVVAAFGLVVFGTQASTHNSYGGESALPSAAAAIHESPLRDGRGVAFPLVNAGTADPDWPDVVGLLVAASREGYQPCIPTVAWEFVVTSQYICSPSQAKDRWSVDVYPSNVAVPSGATVVFRNASIEAYAPSQP